MKILKTLTLLAYVVSTAACSFGAGGNNQRLYLPYYSETDGGQVVITPVDGNGESVVSFAEQTFQGNDLQEQTVQVQINQNSEVLSVNAGQAYNSNTQTVDFRVGGLQHGDSLNLALPQINEELVYQAQVSETSVSLATTDFFNVTLSEEVE